MMHDPLTARFSNPGHPYPEMCLAGLGHLWVGPRRNDFEPWLLKAAIAHLKKHELPHELGDGKNYIRNRILQQDWGALELREEEGEALAAKAAARDSPLPPGAAGGPLAQELPKAGLDLTPEEREERRRQIAEVKRRLGHG